MRAFAEECFPWAEANGIATKDATRPACHSHHDTPRRADPFRKPIRLEGNGGKR